MVARYRGDIELLESGIAVEADVNTRNRRGPDNEDDT